MSNLAYKLGQIGPKWDESGTLLMIRFSTFWLNLDAKFDIRDTGEIIQYTHTPITRYQHEVVYTGLSVGFYPI